MEDLKQEVIEKTTEQVIKNINVDDKLKTTKEEFETSLSKIKENTDKNFLDINENIEQIKNIVTNTNSSMVNNNSGSDDDIIKNNIELSQTVLKNHNTDNKTIFRDTERGLNLSYKKGFSDKLFIDKTYNIDNYYVIGQFLSQFTDPVIQSFQRRSSAILEDIGKKSITQNSFQKFYDDDGYTFFNSSKEMPTPYEMNNSFKNKKFNLGTFNLIFKISKETIAYETVVQMNLPLYLEIRTNNMFNEQIAQLVIASKPENKDDYITSFFAEDLSYIDLSTYTDTPVANQFGFNQIGYWTYDSSVANSVEESLMKRIVRLKTSLHVFYQKRAKFYMNNDTWYNCLTILDLDEDFIKPNDNNLFQVDKNFLKGKEVRIDDFLPTGVILYGDLSQFYVLGNNPKMDEFWSDKQNINDPARIGFYNSYALGGGVENMQSVRFLFDITLLSGGDPIIDLPTKILEDKNKKQQKKK